ncbi:MAG: pyridoxamine 5'-phosphate oxidase family protein [Candidatus Heimdallarchaeota archaeon]|nr:MAG: pyridoxamine 5'-phosphate oxidase family protein [Candidatus Heimdallarchaeota archaeon]
MKLGSMQPPKEYKFLQEQIFEFWPFNKFKSPMNVFLLLILYVIWGMTLFLYYDIPIYYFIAGFCGVFGLFLWTIGIFSYADNLRSVQVERINAANKKFLTEFLENLFHPSSLVVSVLVFSVVITYYFSSTTFGVESLLVKIQQDMNLNTLPPIFLLYIFLLTFDLCYRLGLSLYVILTQIRRNVRLAGYLKSPLLRTSFSPVDIANLEKMDYYNYMAICSSFTLLPLGIIDLFLLYALILFIVVTFSLMLVNIVHLRILYTRSFPQGLLSLLRSAKLARVATISTNRFPHVVPTLFVFDGRSIFIATSIISQKVKNLKHNANIAIFIDSQPDGDLTKGTGVLVAGHAKIYGYNMWMGIIYYLVRGFRMVRLLMLFRRKYPHYISHYLKGQRDLPRAWQVYPIISRAIVEIIPDQLYFWKASRPTLVKF